MTETEDYDKSADPTAHASSHESGGSDEIDVSGLVHKSTFSVYLGSDQAIANNDTTKVEYDTELFDRNNDFSLSTFRFTSPADGKYLFSVQALLINLDADKYLRLTITKNGSAQGLHHVYVPISGNPIVLSSHIIDLDEDDYIEIKVIHLHGSSRNLQAGLYRNYFVGTRLY